MLDIYKDFEIKDGHFVGETVPSGDGKFDGAIGYFWLGQKLRRRSWPKGHFIQAVESKIIDHENNKYILSDEDIFSEDWELINPNYGKSYEEAETESNS